MTNFKAKYAANQKPFDLEVRFARDQRPATINDMSGTYPANTCYGSCMSTCSTCNTCPSTCSTCPAPYCTWTTCTGC